jgi:hypothetical protein
MNLSEIRLDGVGWINLAQNVDGTIFKNCRHLFIINLCS